MVELARGSRAAASTMAAAQVANAAMDLRKAISIVALAQNCRTVE